MNIEQHIIQDSEIIGIGPLMVKASTDQVMRQIYNTKKLTYDIHLHQRSITIESNFFNIGFVSDNDEETTKAREDYKKFFDGYNETKTRIESLISVRKNV